MEGMRLSAFGPVNRRLNVKPAGRRKKSMRNDVDAVAVVVERCLVEQRGADDIGRMHDGTVGRISEQYR